MHQRLATLVQTLTLKQEKTNNTYICYDSYQCDYTLFLNILKVNYDIWVWAK
jgi:hypothetical protein